MGHQVIVNYRVMPTGVEVDLEALKKSIADNVKEFAGQVGFKEQPIAFGLKAVDIAMVIDEEVDEAVQEVIKGLDNVQSVSVLSMSLV